MFGLILVQHSIPLYRQACIIGLALGMLHEILSVCFLLARYTKLSFMTRSSVFERVMISQLTDCNAIHVRAFLTVHVIGGHITFDMYPHGALQVFHWASRWQIDHY